MAFRSLTTRLIFWTLLASGAVLVVTLAASDRSARRTAIAAAGLEARQRAERLANRLGGTLSTVEESAELLAAVLETTQPPPGAIERMLRRFVAHEPDVYGAGVAYAPGEAPFLEPTAGPAVGARGPRLFAPYVYGSSDRPGELHFVDLAARAERYDERDWYVQAVRERHSRWSEPYRDLGGSGLVVVSYAVPFFGAAGEPRGVTTADVPVKTLALMVREAPAGRAGRAILLSAAGRVLALSDAPSLDGRAPALDELPAEIRAGIEPLARYMRAGSAEFVSLAIEGRNGRALCLPIARARWSLALYYPDQELLRGAHSLRSIEAAFGLLGLGTLTLVVVVLSRRLTAPLRELAEAARGLAANLQADLPPVRSQDELGALTTAFREMRDALRRYVADLQQTMAVKQRLESELKIASRIQMDMLPPRHAGDRTLGYEVAALLEPARAVGGDLFSHVGGAGRLLVLVADVSGKGVPAALFMARAKTLFEAASSRLADPSALLAEVNAGLCRENRAGMYVTAVCGALDLATGVLAVACAGHPPPIRLRAGSAPSPLALAGGTVLGLFEGASYPTDHAPLAPGDGVFVFTDGVDEAFDSSGRLFGMQRLLAALEPLAGAAAERVNAGVREALRTFADGAEQSDDITMLTLRYLGAPQR